MCRCTFICNSQTDDMYTEIVGVTVSSFKTKLAEHKQTVRRAQRRLATLTEISGLA